jgi:hypothetical protein
MNSETKSIFSILPYDITSSIFEMHTTDYNIHNNNLKYIHNELILNYTCENCDCIKNSYLYKAQFCSVACYTEANSINDDYSEDEEDPHLKSEIQSDYEEKMFYKQEYKEYIKYKKNNKIQKK